AIALSAATTALAASLPASAQNAAAAKKPAAKTASAKVKPSAPNPAEMAALKESYAAMPLAERLAIQSDLVWSGDYNGGVNGDFGERSIAAVKAFQKKHKAKETGLLDRKSTRLNSSHVKISYAV